MKPISFDLAPLVQTLRPSAPPEQPQPQSKRKAAPGNAPQPLAVFPRYMPSKRGWAPTVALEQLHALTTHILVHAGQHNTRVIGVTSAVAGEGKTTITLGLAERLAAAGKRVQIIDLDTHRRTLSLEAHLGDAAGVQEASHAGVRIEDVKACQTDRPNVTILPSGSHNGNADSPVLEARFLQEIIHHALRDNDFVLLDCPPLLPVAETHVVREAVDGIVLVVRATSTPREIVETALDEFGKDKVIAAVLNRAQPHFIPYFREVYGYYRRDQSSSH
ncbi:MAG: tyrosine-protein kinase family protein [Planctomycetota bacterium]